MASLAMVPGLDVLLGWQSVNSALAWAGLPAARWAAIATELGDADLENLGVLVAIPSQAIRVAAGR
eukprot:11500914-Heterocapsa_arctica.AAC.1